MGEKAKRLVLMGKGGPWELEEFDVPHPGPGQLLVKIMASTICNQTDLNTIKAKHPAHDHQKLKMQPHHFRMWDNRTANDPLADLYVDPYPFDPYPTLMGHEGMGVVVEVGPETGTEEVLGVDMKDLTDEFFLGLTPSEPFKVGDRVTCMGVNGSYGQYAIVPVRSAAHVPDDVPDMVAAYAEMVGFTNLMPAMTTNYGDTVVVLGAGVVGLLSIIFLRKIYNAGMIIAVDPQPMKRARALQYGADYAIDSADGGEVIKFILEKTHGKGANAVMECIGVEGSVRLIPYITATGASVAQMGAGCDPAFVDWSYIHFKGLNIISTISLYTKYGANSCSETAIKVMNDPRVAADLATIVTHKMPLTVEATNDIFARIDRGDEVLKAVYLPWDENLKKVEHVKPEDVK